MLQVVWLAALLGIGIQLALLALAMAGSGLPEDLRPLVGQFAQKVSWATLVCVSLTAGTAITSMQPAAMSALGLLGAPLAFTLARAVQKTVNQSLDVAGAPDAVSPALQAGVKGLEYACLGLALGWLGKQVGRGIKSYAGVGGAHGLVFGGLLLVIINAGTGATMPPLSLAGFAINELLFPMGCSLVLYATTRVVLPMAIAYVPSSSPAHPLPPT